MSWMRHRLSTRSTKVNDNDHLTKKRSSFTFSPPPAFSAWQEHNLAAICQRLATVRAARPGIVHEQISAYNHIIVRRTRNQLLLCYRHPRSQVEEIESRLALSAPLVLPSAYTQAMLLALIWQPHPRRILLIGLGGGRLQMVLHHYLERVTLHTVELDPLVVETAKRFFGIVQDGRQQIIVQDGRDYLRQTAGRRAYDLILLDAYRVEGVPYHLTTQEFYTECRACLAPGGVVASNLHSGIPGYEAVRTTFEMTWPHTVVVPVFGGNVVLIGGELAALDKPALSARLNLVEQQFLSHISLTRLAHSRDTHAGYGKIGRVLHDTDQRSKNPSIDFR